MAAGRAASDYKLASYVPVASDLLPNPYQPARPLDQLVVERAGGGSGGLLRQREREQWLRPGGRWCGVLPGGRS
jgi:hypothetical protein